MGHQTALIDFAARPSKVVGALFPQVSTRSISFALIATKAGRIGHWAQPANAGQICAPPKRKCEPMKERPVASLLWIDERRPHRKVSLCFTANRLASSRLD